MVSEFKLDKKNKKILHYLDIDSRQSLSQLAKRVGLSKQVIDYRIKEMLKEKVILNFYSVINFSKLGYTHYKLYFKFQNVNPINEEKIIHHWVSCKNSVWVALCRGIWDLAVSIISKDTNELGGIIDDFTNKFSKFILEKNILITQISPVFTKNYLIDEKEKKEFVYIKKNEKYELDEDEIKILSILSTNARISIIELMEKTGLSRDVISYRLKKLKEEEILSQFRVNIDLNNIGYRLYKIILRLKNLSSGKEEEIKSFVKGNLNGVQFLKVLGNWDIELEFEIQNEEELHKILQEIRSEFSDIIRDYHALSIHKEYKLNYFPF
ncbi:MAG: Lrp/AsnC family transcriptional regulator [Candidatus Pacearchaeota archaeon]